MDHFKIIEPKRHHDARGHFNELFNNTKQNHTVAQINHSFSHKHVLRGIHQAPFYKLVTAVTGKIFDVCVDLRKDSPNYLKVYTAILDSKIGNQAYIPKDCGHGFLALEDSTVIYYQGDTYDPKTEITIRFDSLNIPWPIQNPIVSDRDRNAEPLKIIYKN